MKLVSWNVNGIRAAVGKGFYDFFKDIDADIFSLQETKLQENQVDDELKKITRDIYLSASAARWLLKYNTTVTYGLGIDEHDKEGRIITLEYDKFYLVNCYTPNSKRELERLDYRMIWEDEIREYLKKLDLVKPVIYCGDLNVAHNEIDLKNPSSNHHNAGFTDQERGKMTELLSSGFTDTYRYKYPDETGKYTWWSYMFHAREKNAGWRIDYFIVSNRIADKIVDAKIHNEIMGSDHCPIELDIKL